MVATVSRDTTPAHRHPSTLTVVIFVICSGFGIPGFEVAGTVVRVIAPSIRCCFDSFRRGAAITVAGDGLKDWLLLLLLAAVAASAIHFEQFRVRLVATERAAGVDYRRRGRLGAASLSRAA